MSVVSINKNKKVYLPEGTMEGIEHSIDVANQMVASGNLIVDGLKAINSRFDSVNERADFIIAELAKIKTTKALKDTVK